jgi:uncharacterized protein (TIGR04255 family)
MPGFEHLPKAPITEALLEIQVRSRDVDPGIFKALAKELAPEFPRVTERTQIQATWQFNEGAVASSDQQARTEGYVFWSADGLDVAQFRVDGFTLNRLKSYQSWEEWFPRFIRLWTLYTRVVAPSTVSRVAARCINHIPISGGESLGSYLTRPPQVPPGVPETVKGFLSRVELSGGGDPELVVNLVQGIVPGTGDNPLLLLLDVEAMVTGTIEPTSVLKWFDSLHEVRNKAFFQSLTPETVAKFR